MTFVDDKAIAINALITAVEAIETALGSLPAGPYASVRTRLDILEARINNPFAPSPNVTNPFFIGGSPISGVSIQDGYGDPNTLHLMAVSGSLYLREDGYNNQGLYTFRPDGYWYQMDTRRRRVTPVTASYTIQTTDDLIAVTIFSAPLTLTMPSNPLLGDSYDLKDTTGNAGVNNITVNGNGTNIDGSSTFIMNTAFATLTLVFTGTQWSII